MFGVHTSSLQLLDAFLFEYLDKMAEFPHRHVNIGWLKPIHLIQILHFT